jgi:hypothetical protein
MSVSFVRGVGRFVVPCPVPTALMVAMGWVVGIAVAPMTSVASMTAMPFVHEHMHQGTQQHDGQRQPAERPRKVGAVLDAEIEQGQRQEDPEDPTSGP